MAKKKNESGQDWLAELERNLEVVALGEAEYEAEIAAVEARHREYLKAKKKLAALSKAHLEEIGSGETAHASYETVTRGTFDFVDPTKAQEMIKKIMKLERFADIEVAELKPKLGILKKLLTDEEKAKFGLADIPHPEFSWSRIG